MNTYQSFIDGFVKRVMEYGYSEAEASEAFEKVSGFLGNPAYTGVNQAGTELEEGSGVGAHLKRNSGKYVGNRLLRTNWRPTWVNGWRIGGICT